MRRKKRTEKDTIPDSEMLRSEITALLKDVQRTQRTVEERKEARDRLYDCLEGIQEAPVDSPYEVIDLIKEQVGVKIGPMSYSSFFQNHGAADLVARGSGYEVFVSQDRTAVQKEHYDWELPYPCSYMAFGNDSDTVFIVPTEVVHGSLEEDRDVHIYQAMVPSLLSIKSYERRRDGLEEKISELESQMSPLKDQ